MREWREVTIGELCEEGGGNVQTGPFGSQLKASAYVPNGIPTVMPANLVDFRISEEGIARISREDHQRLSKHHLRPGDIVYGRRGEIGRHALVTEKENGWLCGTGCLRIRFGDAEVEPRYVSYYLRQPEVIQMILGMAVGTTMPNLNTTIVKSIPLRLPPLPVQRRIVQILGRLDDKIEVNRRINRTLEDMARALYRHWFVDFGPFQDGEFVESELGLIPKGWEVSTLGAECQVVSGGTPSTKVPEYWEEGDILWATPTDMTSLKAPVIFDTTRKITQSGLENSSAKMLPPGSVLMSSRATLGVAAINYAPISTNQGFKSMIPGPRVNAPYLLLYIQHNQNEILNRASGTTFMEINTRNFKALKILIPPSEVMRAFDAIVGKYYDQIYAHERENVHLSATRDYLLPRLLSGEVNMI